MRGFFSSKKTRHSGKCQYDTNATEIFLEN